MHAHFLRSTESMRRPWRNFIEKCFKKKKAGSYLLTNCIRSLLSEKKIVPCAISARRSPLRRKVESTEKLKNGYKLIKELFLNKKKLAVTYFPAKSSIIGVRELDFRVRNGNGYCLSTKTTSIFILDYF